MPYQVLFMLHSPHVVADMVLWPLAGFFYGSLALVPLTIIEGILIRRIFKWSKRKSYLSAFFANWLSTTGFLISALIQIVSGSITGPSSIGLSLWTSYRYWLIIALALWLAYFIGTVLIETVILRLADRKNRQRPRFAHFIKLTAYVNLVTYTILLPFWIFAQYPRFGDFIPVPASSKPPGIVQLFLYDRPDGTIWLADTQGNHIARIAEKPDLQYDQFIGFKTTEDAAELVTVVATKKRSEDLQVSQGQTQTSIEGNDEDDSSTNGPAWVVTDEKEIVRFDLSSLDEKYRETITPDLKLGYPESESQYHYMHSSKYTWRDGTMAAHYIYQYDSLRFYTDVESNVSVDELKSDNKTPVLFRGFVPPQYLFRIRDPHILPGGRYTLVECSDEILLLDVESRDAFILFTGRNPIPLVKPTIFRSAEWHDKKKDDKIKWE